MRLASECGLSGDGTPSDAPHAGAVSGTATTVSAEKQRLGRPWLPLIVCSESQPVRYFLRGQELLQHAFHEGAGACWNLHAEPAWSVPLDPSLGCILFTILYHCLNLSVSSSTQLCARRSLMQQGRCTAAALQASAAPSCAAGGEPSQDRLRARSGKIRSCAHDRSTRRARLPRRQNQSDLKASGFP